MFYNYEDCLARVLKDEGGYSNDAGDPGGPTKYGITIIDYRKYINSKGTAADVKRMTVDQAKTIYKARYWDAQKCSDLPSGVDYAVFDYGVNSGIGRTKKYQGLHLSSVDLVNKICDDRLRFLKGLKTWSIFGKGWGPRVNRVRAHSLELAKNDPHKSVTTPVHAPSTVGPAVGTAAVAAGGLWTWLQSHEYLIIGGAVIAAIALTYLIHKLRNKTNVA